MKEKKLMIKFHKGITYEVPAYHIAQARADYYADTDGYEINSQEWLDELNRTLEDEFLLFDWVQNDMDWEDLQLFAKRIEENDIDLDDEWNEGNHTISIN
jgi:hypothetical protein